MPRKRKKKNWRRYIVNGMPPARYELPDRYENLLTTITNIILGKTNKPKTLHFVFYKTLSYKVFRQTKAWTPHTYLLLRTLIDKLPHISRDDIYQQAWLYLMEMWDFYASRYNHNKKTCFVFYDYVRFNLIRYMSSWMANQILMGVADNTGPVFLEETWMDDPEEIHLDLNWVIVQSSNGKLGLLSTRQKYLVFLRYVKQMTILDISGLTRRHRSAIEEDFSIINHLLGIGGNHANSRH